MPVPEDSERSSKLSWRDKTFVIGDLREGLRKYSGYSEESGLERLSKKEASEPDRGKYRTGALRVEGRP